MRTCLAPLLALTLMTGCIGNSGLGSKSVDQAPAGSNADGSCSASVIATPMLRLTQATYRNSVQTLLPGVDTSQLVLPNDERVGVFVANGAAAFSDTVFSQYQIAAETLAAQVLGNVNNIVPCGTNLTRSCLNSFVQTFGRRAFRRDLDPNELQDYQQLGQLYPANDPNNLRVVITAFLQSPYFLYAPEFGAATPASASGTVRLTSYEIATRLSHLLWSTTPDDKLLNAASSGALDTDAGVQAMAQTMLQDPRASTFTYNFVTGLFNIDDWSTTQKDPNVYPNYTPTLAAAMQQETRDFISSTMKNNGGTLNALLTGSQVPLTDPLFAFYGVSKPNGYIAGTPVQLDATQRAGLLTQGSFLAIHGHTTSSAPILRGKIVRQNLLCQTIGHPPPTAAPNLPAPLPGQSTRDVLLAHETNASCAACHVLMDHIGFGLENFDGMGQWRTADGSASVDSRGNISATKSTNLPFNGSVALASVLANSPDVQACVALQASRYVLARVEDATRTPCATQQAAAVYNSAGGSIQKILLNQLASPSFTTMTPTP